MEIPSLAAELEDSSLSIISTSEELSPLDQKENKSPFFGIQQSALIFF